jgi:hypothetical protein
MSRADVVDRTRKMVAHAKSYCDDIEFSCEDAGRSDPAFLIEVCAHAIEAGATTLNIPDTVGYTSPEEYFELIGRLRAETLGAEGVVWSTQCLLAPRPKTFEIRIDGTLQPGVSAKDVILSVIARIGTEAGTGHVFEYTGSTIRAMSMEERMTVCNMSIEGGARAGLIAPDDTTFD